MYRILIATLAAVSLAGIGTADAARKEEEGAPCRTRSRHSRRLPYPYYARTPGPVWAMPNECFTDEGYGRYWPCGAGRSSF